jgi:dienelactone hydrolase
MSMVPLRSLRVSILAFACACAGSPVACSTASPSSGEPSAPQGHTGSEEGGVAAFDGGRGITDDGSPDRPSDSGPSDSSSAKDGPSTAGDSGQPQPLDAATGTGPYGNAGPSAVTTAMFQVPSPNGTFTTTAYVPAGAGPFPVVVLSSGFFQTALAYAPYADRLASWGIITLTRDDPNLGESTPNVVSDVQYTVKTWLAATNADSSSALYGKVDTTRVGLAGHSRGGQIALLSGEGLPGLIKGVFGLDPVDTSTAPDPEARTTLATIGVPIAMIGETTDSASSSCAPAADNYQVLYAAAASPSVAITAVDADHTMFEDPAHCSFCTLCTAGTASQPVVLATAVRYLTAFFARELLGDASVGAAFQGAGASQDEAAGIITLVSK